MSLWDELEIIQIGQQQVVAMEWMDELQIISLKGLIMKFNNLQFCNHPKIWLIEMQISKTEQMKLKGLKIIQELHHNLY